MSFSRDALAEAKRQIDSTLRKLRKALETLSAREQPDRYRSQITLARRRIRAFEIAVSLVEREMEEQSTKEIDMRQYEYKFVEVSGKTGGSVEQAGDRFEECKRIIVQEAEAGWRLIQIVTPYNEKMGVCGTLGYQIIFEREANP